MALYSGDKALDAEIFLDLETGKLTMDYSLNEKGSDYSSSTSCELKDEFSKLSKWTRVKEISKRLPTTAFFICYCISTMPIITFLLKHKIITNKNYQIEHQLLLKKMFSDNILVHQKIKEGALREPIIVFGFSHNVWMSYKLEGEYQKEIKSIALKRHFQKVKLYGIYEQVRQNGWDLIFEFHHTPKSGSCIVESV
jgi:hypothetical protein